MNINQDYSIWQNLIYTIKCDQTSVIPVREDGGKCDQTSVIPVRVDGGKLL